MYDPKFLSGEFYAVVAVSRLRYLCHEHYCDRTKRWNENSFSNVRSLRTGDEQRESAWPKMGKLALK